MEELHVEALNFQRKFRDLLDDSAHAMARQLDADIQRLEDFIQTKKHPRSVEDHVKRIIQNLERAEEHGIMDVRHLRDLVDRLEDMRRKLQKLV